MIRHTKLANLATELTRIRDFRNKRPSIQSIWTSEASWVKFIQTYHKDFPDSIVVLRQGMFVTPKFENDLTEWLAQARPNVFGRKNGV
jgi:hypothetical protein